MKFFFNFHFFRFRNWQFTIDMDIFTTHTKKCFYLNNGQEDIIFRRFLFCVLKFPKQMSESYSQSVPSFSFDIVLMYSHKVLFKLSLCVKASPKYITARPITISSKLVNGRSSSSEQCFSIRSWKWEITSYSISGLLLMEHLSFSDTWFAFAFEFYGNKFVSFWLGWCYILIDHLFLVHWHRFVQLSNSINELVTYHVFIIDSLYSTIG